MPYNRTQSKLEDLLAKALSKEEIRDGARKADLREDVLKQKFLDPNLAERAPSIWEAAASEIEAYDQLESEIRVRLAELRKEERQMRLSYLRIPRWALITIFVAIPLLISLLIFAQGSWRGISNIIYAVIISAILLIVLSAYTLGCRYLYQRYSASKIEYDDHLADIQRELQSKAHEERLKTAEQTVEEAVIEKGILSELRLIIDNDLKPSYETNLQISSAPGLAEVFDPAYEITTESRSKLRRLLDNMPGGSIGISGPRGVGKTTLLRAICGKASTPELKGRTVLSVMISAPIKYVPREFILHTFSSVCHRVLEMKEKKSPRQPWGYMSGVQKPPVTFLATVTSLKETLAAILLGLVLTVMATPLTGSLLSTSSFFGDLLASFGLLLVLLGVVGLLIQVSEMLQRRRQTQRDELEMRKLYGDDLLVQKAFEWQRDIQFQQSYSSGWAGSLRGSIAPISVETTTEAAMELSRNQMSLPEIVDRYQEFLTLASEDYVIIIGIDELDKIGSDEEAQSFLNEIKALFGQQSCFYLISVSESAMSSFERRGLPFRDVFDSSFDAIVHADYLNLERAQRLLRRRVIGVPVPFLDFCHCMAGGLPRDLIRIFRALFDEHLQSNSGESSLSTLCGSLIRADLKSKLLAASISAKDTMLDLEVKQLFDRIRKLEALLDSPDCFPKSCPDLLTGSRDLLESTSQESTQQAESAEVAAKREKIALLSAELGAYLYYCVTLVQFFGREDLDQETLKAAESSGELERLARARQFLAINPRMAESELADFRQTYNMDAPSDVAARLEPARS